MAQYYVRNSGSTGANGSDSNDGLTTSTPFLTLGKAVSTATDGDTVYSDGRFHEVNVTWTQNNLTRAAWPGATWRPQTRGDVQVDTSGWAGPVGNLYTKTVAAGLTGYCLVANYGKLDGVDLRVLADGGYYGHLKKVASAVAVSNVSEFFYDNTTGVITARFLGDADPATLTYIGIGRAGQGETFNGSNANVSGIDAVLFTESGSGNGYGILVNKTDLGASVTSCNTYDTGYHAIGFRDANSLGCNGCSMSGCNSWGQAGGDASNRPTAWVFYGAGAGKTISACIRSKSSAWCRLPIQEDGTTQIPLWNASLTNTANDVGGGHCHTDGVATTVDVLDIDNRYYYDSNGCLGNPMTGGNGVAPSDYTNFNTWPIRFDRWYASGGGSETPSTRTAFRGGFGYFPRQSVDAHTCTIKLNGVTTFFQANVILGTGAGVTFSRVIYRQGGTNTIYLYNNTFIDYGAAASNLRFFAVLSAADTMIASGNVVSWPNDTKTNGQIVNGPSAATLFLTGNWWPLTARISATGWGASDTTIDTQAEFAAAYPGVYNTDPGWVSPTTSGEPTASGYLRNIVTMPPAVPFFGYNLNPSDGHYGAYQYGISGFASRGRGRDFRRRSTP